MMFTEPYGGYPNGYPPQNYNNNQWQQPVYQQAYDSQYSPFINPTTMVPPQQPVYQQMPGPGYPSPQNISPAQQQLSGSPYAVNGQPMPQVTGFNPYEGYYVQPSMNPNLPMQPPPPPYAPNPFVYSNGNPALAGGPIQYPQGYGYNGYTSSYGANPALSGGFNQYSYGYTDPWKVHDQQFNTMLNEISYGGAVPDFDPFIALRDVILTDDEREISMSRRPLGYGYNGVPLYSNEQIEYQRRYEEESRTFVTNFWISLAKAAHTGSGDNITSEEVEKIYRYNPQPVNVVPQYMEMNRDQMEFAQRLAKVDEMQSLAKCFAQYDQIQTMLGQRIEEGCKKIKESHDKILGFEPGQEVSLKDYMSNAGLLYVDAMVRETNQLRKDGTLRYTSDRYKGLIYGGNGPIQKTYDTALNNDDYVPLESRIKEQYVRAKTKVNIIRNQDGSLSVGTKPPSVDPEIQMARDSFIEAATRGMID